jgi:hypothetical protein
VSSTRIRQNVNAPRASVYRALLDARAVATWMVPDVDPAMRGEMTITCELLDANGGTDLVALHGPPPGLSPADNETGWRLSLAKLKAQVEGAGRSQEG